MRKYAIALSSILVLPGKMAAQEIKEHIIDSIKINAGKAIPRNQVSGKISAKEIRGSRGENLAGVLKNVSGVSLLQSGANNSKPIIQGLTNQRILFINNGVKLGSQHWASDHAPEIDPFFSSEITVVKGAESVKYGSGAMGGTVLINPGKLPYHADISGETSISGVDNSQKWTGGISLKGGLKKTPFAWRVQANAKKAGDYSTAEYVVSNTGIRERQFLIQAGYKTAHHEILADFSLFSTKLGVYQGTRTGDIEDFKKKIQYGRPLLPAEFSYDISTPYQEATHRQMKLLWKQNYSFGKIDFSYAYQNNLRQEYEARRGPLSDRPSQDWNLITQTAGLNFESSYDFWKTQAGVELTRQKNHNNPGNGITPAIPNYVSQNYAAYFLQSFREGKWSGEAGSRYDFRYFNLAGYNSFDEYYSAKKQFGNFTHQLSVSYDVKEWLQVTSHLGLAWRPPEANELFMEGYSHGMAIYYIGNRDLKSEKGLKWSGRVKMDFPKTKLEIDGFVQKINGFIYEVPSGEFRTTFSGVYPIFRYRQDEALFRGVDLDFSQMITDKLRYRLQASIVYADNSETKKPLPMIPSERTVQSMRLNLKKIGGLDHNYLEFQHQWTAKQRRFVAEQDLVDHTPPAYQLFHLMAGTSVEIYPNRPLYFDLKVSNLFNVLYKEYTDRFRYFAHLQGRQVQCVITFNF